MSENLAAPVIAPAEVEFEAKPVFRYHDQPRGFKDGTMWLWTAQGRPVGVCKVEDWRDKVRGPEWITCFSSLSTELVEVKWENGPDWTAKKPGLKFRSITDFEAPDPNEAARLRQFKALSERFTISLEWTNNGGDLQQLRRLPRHLHRYHAPQADVADAVIFAWTTNGTNPDALIVIEQRTREHKHEWHYALAPVTSDQIVLSMGDQVVETRPVTLITGGDTVRFFFEKNAAPID